MSEPLKCFTAYDVRGRVPEELNKDIAARIGLAFCRQIDASKVVIGHDIRLSSPEISENLCQVLTRGGIEVIDIGLCCTEEIYFAVFHGEKEGVDGGIMITASHNPSDYNGMKFVRQGARPMSSDSGLLEVAEKAASTNWYNSTLPEQPDHIGRHSKMPNKYQYISHLLSSVDKDALQPLKIVVNAGNGCAGPVIDLLEQHLPVTFIKLNHEPDGSFPKGVPNPLLPENREETARAVREHGADLGLAWDGDADRCFFFDENGRFIEGYYIVGLLAAAMLKRHPGATLLHDPRLTWNTQEIVQAAGGKAVMTKTGHAFIKEAMRQEQAVYGGEMSAHHYFQDFGYCDSGMLPWLLVVQLISQQKTTLSALVDERMRAYPVSGEINSTVTDPDATLQQVEEQYSDGEKDYTDGLSVSYPEFRFNLRKSNTEPVLRLNVETRADTELLQKKTEELLALIRA
ncbi:phosphomannomutase [Candidatus Electrothrix aarhusensis]|uniref:Phosphomannomutase n=1 Tax=Candidatus Electrothrix aarhusensis TaxID=1859131 RepID=A0A444IZQ0_9BACT|nr:phosphomannomutase [Candidatus Electrothrix aarhusensis]